MVRARFSFDILKSISMGVRPWVLIRIRFEVKVRVRARILLWTG